MYDPVQDGIAKTTRSVAHTEIKPPSALADVVHSFWELRTEAMLTEDFCLHALPDACVNILFNQQDTRIAGITALRTSYEVLNLGKMFHYVGIQFFPGVWRGDLSETADSFVGTPYRGDLPLIDISKKLEELNFSSKQAVLTELVLQLMEDQWVSVNVVVQKILINIESIYTVADMAAVTDISPRQLQRVLKKSTGFTPHDFLKVIRLQKTFKEHYLDSYSDQSHFIHSFREITGYTPAEYYRTFDV